jgi:hypothetical protein
MCKYKRASREQSHLHSEFKSVRAGPDLTLDDPVRPPRAHDRKGPILYTFAHKYYCFGLIFFREKIHMGLSGRGLEIGKHTH